MSQLLPLEFTECIVDSPIFRENLLQHEKEIENSYKVFKDIYNSIKTVFDALEDCSHAFCSLAENLNKYLKHEDKSDCMSTDDEKTIKDSLSIYSEIISNIETMRNEHILGATKDLVMDDLQKLKNECLSKSRQEIKEFKKVTSMYYGKLDKYAATKYRIDFDYKTVDGDISEERRKFVERALSHVVDVQQTEEQKTCKLVHTLSLLVQMMSTYHHQVWDHFVDQKKKMDDVNCALYRTEENYKVIAENTEQLKQHYLRQPLEQVQNSVLNNAPRREGYLYVLSKKSVMSDVWTKNFSVYDKLAKTLSVITCNPSVQISGKELPEQYVVINCERRKSGSIDRRFCFDIKVHNRLNPITLQALSQEDLKQWLDIMDGKEPIYAKPNEVTNVSEIETVINEKGMKYLSACFLAIEKRGIETVGIYRTCGRMSHTEKLIKKIADDLRLSSSLDQSIIRELENQDVSLLCSLVKFYIKYLRQPLGTFALYNEFINAGKLSDADSKYTAVYKVLQKLPNDHYQLFYILMKHLKTISDKSDINQMTPPNLGVCFSPTVFRPEQATASFADIRDSKFAGGVISILIERYEDFFPSPESPTPRLIPSKSMYIGKADAFVKTISNDLSSSEFDLRNNLSNHISPKPRLRRNFTERTRESVAENKPQILSPKPIYPRRETCFQISPLTSSNVRQTRNFDSPKISGLGGSYQKKRAKTIYLYVAENKCQLSFDANKIVTNVRDSDDSGWLLGTIDGRDGLIPRNFVEILPS